MLSLLDNLFFKANIHILRTLHLLGSHERVPMETVEIGDHNTIPMETSENMLMSKGDLKLFFLGG